MSAAEYFLTSLSTMASLSMDSPLKSLSYDLVKTVLDMTEFKYADLKDLTKGFPIGSYHRVDMEYRTETQRLLEERYAYYLEKIKCSGIKAMTALHDAPRKLRDREMYLEAVKLDGYILLAVPEEFLDREMCLMAVKANTEALQFVPWELRDREMCLEAVKRDGYILKSVPEVLRDREMCLVAVKDDHRALDCVPRELRDREMCLEAIKNYGYALQYVPKELLDREMCLEAVKSKGNVIEYVPKEFLDHEICLEAVKKDGNVLRWVPMKFRVLEICIAALLSQLYCQDDIPLNLRTDIDKHITCGYQPYKDGLRFTTSLKADSPYLR